MLKLSRRQVDHEDVVAEGYGALRRAALYLTRGDEGEAGDLLHDTFVRFLLLRPRLDAIGNLDGYLYTMLRNVYLSRQRRHVRRRAVVAESIEVELLAVMIDAPEADERLRMRDDLLRLVDHARERTRVSRAASAWILRCVHGYYPAEIARLMKMPPRAVDRALHVARREALEELRKPTRRRRDGDGGGYGRGDAGDGGRGAVGFGRIGTSVSAAGRGRWRDLHVDLRAGVSRIDGQDCAEPLDPLQALRLRLFASVEGPCLTDGAIAELYRPLGGSDSGSGAESRADSEARSGSDTPTEPGSGQRADSDARLGWEARGDFDHGQRRGSNADEYEAPVGTLLVAHVVACADCLDRINQHLDLPPLKTRDPVESSGTRQRRDGDSGRGRGPGSSSHPGPGGSAGARQVEPHGEAKGGSASRGGAGLDPLMRRTRDTLASILDHIPRELRIAANGLELGALPVAGVVTVQELAVRLAEALAFVEIFDERGELVCYWPACVPHEGALDDDITIELPHGRSIELRVSLMDDCPRLRVRYTDARVNPSARADLARDIIGDGVHVHDGTGALKGARAHDDSDLRAAIGIGDGTGDRLRVHDGAGAQGARGRHDRDISAAIGIGDGIGDRLRVHDGPGAQGARGRDDRGTSADIGVGDTLDARKSAALRDIGPSTWTAIADAAHRPRWWHRLVPSPRFAIVGSVLVVLWMIVIGPTTTWAAIDHLGRTAAAVIRTLFTSRRPVTPAPKPAPGPAGPAASTSGTSAAPGPVAPPRGGAVARVFNPSELSDLEMAVRIALHEVHADLGEDVTLRATPTGVIVHGIVGSTARRDAIVGALDGLDGARVNVRTADEIAEVPRAKGNRATSGGAPLQPTRSPALPRLSPLSRPSSVSSSSSPARHEDAAALSPGAGAESNAASEIGESPVFANAIQEALAARMPAPADRAAFVNDTLARADDALARAWALRRLAERYQPRDVTALSRRSSQSLATLVGAHTAALRAAVDTLLTRVTPLVAAAEKLDAGRTDIHGDTTPRGTSRDTRLSVMEMFTLVNAWHADAHALMAGASVTPIVPTPAPSDATGNRNPGASSPDAREWLYRLHRIQDALKEPDFAQSTLTPASAR